VKRVENAILYPPPNDPRDFMSWFQEGDNPRDLCVAVHDVPSEHDWAQRIRGLESQTSLYDLSSKTGIAYFATSQVAAQAYTAFVDGGFSADVLNRHGIDAAFRQLSNGQQPFEWKDCVVYLSHLPQITNFELFMELSAFGKVVAACQRVNPDGGNGTGIAVFTTSDAAASLLRLSSTGSFVIQGTWVSAQRFRNERFTIYQPRKSEARIVPPPIVNGTSRRWLKNFVMANVPPGKWDVAWERIEAMSINQTVEMEMGAIADPDHALNVLVEE
jgi:hypothetical protein